MLPSTGKRQLEKARSCRQGGRRCPATLPCSRRQAQSGHQTPPRGQDENRPLDQAGAAFPGGPGLPAAKKLRAGRWAGPLVLLWRIGWGRKGAGGRKTERRRFCLLLWTRKHEPVFRGRSPERPGNKRRETMVGGRSHGRGWERRGEPGALPARAEGAERGRNLLLNFLSRIRVVCARSRKHRKKGDRARREPPIVPSAPRDVKRPGNRAFREPWHRQRGRNPPQRATPSAGSLGRRAGAARSVTGGRVQGRRTIGPLWGAVGGRLPEPLIPRQERASF